MDWLIQLNMTRKQITIQNIHHFLKNFGTEFLINIYLDEELLNYEDKILWIG